jgi:serine/threonine protein kinase
MECERTINGYEIGTTLGSGLQGKVKLGVHTSTGEVVALKIIDRKKLKARELHNLQREIMSMKLVQHANVINLKAIDHNARYPKKDGSSKEVILLVLELATGGELFDFMMYTGSFSEDIARTYFQHLIKGIAQCHSKGVYHRDIKPENLLLDGDFSLKIADFGLSALHEEDNGAATMLHTQCGTRGYMAPEILNHQPYEGKSVDVWAAGCVLFIMLAGFPPFQIAASSDWWFRAISHHQYPAFWAAHSRQASFSTGAMQLMSRIFVADPAQRITVDEILADPWFSGSSLTQDSLQTELQRRQLQVQREKRREKEAERRKKEAARRQKEAQNDREFDPFNQNIFRAVPGFDDAAVKLAAEEAARLPAMLESKAGDNQVVASYTSFYTAEPAHEVHSRLCQALAMMSVEYKSTDSTFKLKASTTTPTGKVDFVCQVYQVEADEGASGEPLHVVRVKRRNGSQLKFHELFQKLEESLADITVPAPGEEFDEGDFQEPDEGNNAADEDADELANEVQLL